MRRTTEKWETLSLALGDTLAHIRPKKGWECIRAVETIFRTLEARWMAVLGPERMELLRADLRRLIRTSESSVMSYRLRPTW